MDRRDFLTTSLAASAAAATGSAAAQTSAGPETGSEGRAGRSFYELRRYHLQSGPQLKAAESYFREALIPALNRQGLRPVGAFKLDIGPETPAFYLLIPSPSVGALVDSNLRLEEDTVFQKAAASFWGAPAQQPAFLRVDSSLMIAFAGRPNVTPPLPAATGTVAAKRIFQLRTYESPTDAAHVRKVAMFHDGEFEIFKQAGFEPVFYGDTLIGSRLPNLTYMLAFHDMNDLNTKWDVFRNNPAWKKLSGSARYGSEAIVSNITNLLLSPLACSQI